MADSIARTEAYEAAGSLVNRPLRVAVAVTNTGRARRRTALAIMAKPPRDPSLTPMPGPARRCAGGAGTGRRLCATFGNRSRHAGSALRPFTTPFALADCPGKRPKSR